MKVEFLDSDVFGPELFVSASEFLKAEKNNKEYKSLAHATEAFANLFGVEYHISEDEYDAVISQLEKTGAGVKVAGTMRQVDFQNLHGEIVKTCTVKMLQLAW